MTPLISCLCLADGPLPRVKDSIRCFAAQTHPRRELLVGVEPGSWRAAALQRYVASLGDPSVVVVAADALTAQASGELVCAWSPTASSHPERLAVQVRTLAEQGGRCCVVLDWLWCVPAERSLYWVGGTEVGGTEVGGTASGAPPAGVADTLLAEVEVYERCRNSLTAGEWPADSAGRVSGGGLIVEFADRKGETESPSVVDCLPADVGRPLLRQVARALGAHRIPRPILVQLRGVDDTLVVLDATDDGGVWLGRAS